VSKERECITPEQTGVLNTEGGRGNLLAFFSFGASGMNQKGFTLVELVMVIILLAITAMAVIPRIGDVTASKASVFVEKIRADIRYAQNLATTQNRRYRVYVNTPPGPPSGYAVVNDANGNGTWGEAGEIAADPSGGGPLSITLAAGQYAGITVSTPPGGYFEFNSLGAATVGGGSAIVVNGNPALTVTVAGVTGAVN
jgi:prepilin-type N-terminal cleavage/methylation domain-containing protein